MVRCLMLKSEAESFARSLVIKPHWVEVLLVQTKRQLSLPLLLKKFLPTLR